jgi:Cys-tRNA(Pro) deacylase
MDASTPATEAIAATGIDHEVVVTERASSVEEAAALRGVSVAALLKTLVVRVGNGDYRFVLVPGDRSIDWPKLRSALGVRRMTLPDAAEALEATGYERGTITPFGSTTVWPVVADAAIPDTGPVSIGGGAHSVSLRIADPAELLTVLDADVADVTRAADSG